MLIFKKYWKSISWALFILIICVLPSDDIEKVRFFVIPYMDKFVHLGLYFVFALLLLSDKIGRINSIKFKDFLIVIVIAFSYGVLIELIQLYLTSTRSADLWDVAADSIGIFIGLVNYKWINKITNRII